MTTVRCPKCSDQVTMPVGLSGEATVRCPLCAEQYKLAEITALLPPALVVIDAGPAPAGLAYSGFAGHEAEHEPGFSIEGESGGVAGFAVERAPTIAAREGAPAGRRPGRPAKKPKNALVEGIKIIGGGVAGLVIGQLILWWIPWDRFLPVKAERRDPLGLGPKVAQYVSFIVPEQFATKTKPQPATDGTEDATRAAAKDEKPPAKPKTKPQGGEDEKPKRNGEGPFDWPAAPEDDGEAKPNEAGNTTKTPAKVSRPGTKPKPKPAKDGPPDIDSKLDLDDNPLGMGDDSKLDLPDLKVDPLAPLDLPPVTLPVTTKEEKPKPAKPASPPADEEEKPAPPDTPPAHPLAVPATSAETLSQSLAAAQEAAKAWQEKDDPDAKGYQALSKVAECLAFARELDAASAAAAQEILKGLAAKPKSMGLISKAGPLWLGSDKRITQGVLLLGVVADVDKRGPLHQTTLKLDDGQSVLLLSDKDPAALYKPDNKILVLGGIVEDPAKNVTGYEGDAARIVWTGVSQIVP